MQFEFFFLGGWIRIQIRSLNLSSFLKNYFLGKTNPSDTHVNYEIWLHFTMQKKNPQNSLFLLFLQPKRGLIESTPSKVRLIAVNYHLCLWVQILDLTEPSGFLDARIDSESTLYNIYSLYKGSNKKR